MLLRVRGLERGRLVRVEGLDAPRAQAAGDPRVQVALRDWVMLSDQYEAFDALLSSFDFPGKDVLVQRGRQLFPGPLTSHWTDR